ncbi:uncharacterized protein [Coffea arabica]|uniref:Uncharacterized protein n=1 Tax=Coffea arabica TaxID=13443 RepID=A0A6P6TGV6_COFAR|nr:uncharacterized protein LOC113701328 [Coffea arabica]
MASLDRKSSIENEPRTLNIQQFQLAREAALYVMSTRSMEEALGIFTKGLEPVVNCVRENEATMMDYDYEDLEISHNQLRDIESAPF